MDPITFQNFRGSSGTTDNYWLSRLVTSYNNGSSDFPRGIGIDSDNNIYAASTIAGPAANNGSILISKYTFYGTMLWQRVLGNGNIFTQSLYVDSSGNSYVLGRTSTNTGVLAKYDSNGNILWQIQINNYLLNGGSVVVDSNQNIFVTSYINAANNYIIGLYKFNSSGNLLLQKHFSTNLGTTIVPYFITTDSNNNVYIGGTISPISTVTATFLAKFDNSGVLIWSKIISAQSSYSMVIKGLKVDSSGNIYIISTLSRNSYGFAVIKLSNAPSILWSTCYLTSASISQGFDIILDPIGGLYAFGFTGSRNIITKFNDSGSVLLNRDITFNNGYLGSNIILDSNGNIYTSYGSKIYILKYPSNGSRIGDYFNNVNFPDPMYISEATYMSYLNFITVLNIYSFPNLSLSFGEYPFVNSFVPSTLTSTVGSFTSNTYYY